MKKTYFLQHFKQNHGASDKSFALDTCAQMISKQESHATDFASKGSLHVLHFHTVFFFFVSMTLHTAVHPSAVKYPEIAFRSTASSMAASEILFGKTSTSSSSARMGNYRHIKPEQFDNKWASHAHLLENSLTMHPLLWTWAQTTRAC